MAAEEREPRDPLLRGAVTALRRTVAEVWETARREGTWLVIAEDGKVVRVHPQSGRREEVVAPNGADEK